jgi:hypothetical protein
MAARTIVTSRPDVFCAVCGRRLLAGERPSRFLAGAEAVDVCELCTPQAREDGWRPAEDGGRPEGPQAAAKRRRGGPIARLRAALGARIGASAPARGRARGGGELDGRIREEGRPERPRSGQTEPDHAGASADRAQLAAPGARAQGTGGELAAALDLFNQTAETQRIAGVARTLGAPVLTIRPAPPEGLGASAHPERFILTAAWEISWYRWELDLAAAALQAKLLASGHDPEELPAEELTGNCAADERGRLMLL